MNLYDMDMRDYDPAIARWTGVDPVTHFSQSPYNAFDGNPVYFSDPSGADGLPPEPINTWHYAGGNQMNTGAGNLSAGDHMFGQSGDDFWNSQTAYTGFSDEYKESHSTSSASSSVVSAQVGLSEDSFNFESTTVNWQAAGVTDLSLTVQNLTNKTKEVNFELEVGLPMTLKNGTKISPRLAQSASADAANQTAAIIGTSARLTNGRFYNAPAIVKFLFAKTMQRNLNSILSTALGVPASQVGSRVNSSIISNITPTKAVWNNVSAFQQLGIWMRSWF